MRTCRRCCSGTERLLLHARVIIVVLRLCVHELPLVVSLMTMHADYDDTFHVSFVSTYRGGMCACVRREVGLHALCGSGPELVRVHVTEYLVETK